MTKPTYIVSAYDTKEKVWKTVLATGDKAEADGMVEMMKADKVKTRVETFSKPKKR